MNKAVCWPSEYGWHSFIKEQGQLQTEVYSFVAALSASNIAKQALFHASETAIDYSDLHVYLDSPIIFALLGMDDISRTESYKQLVADMLKARCSVHVLDHNFQEVDSIIARAAGWATNTLSPVRCREKMLFQKSEIQPRKANETIGTTQPTDHH